MKKLILALLLAPLMAQINIHTLKSRFIQKVINEQNRTLQYEGVIYFKAPNLLRWEYTYPLKKSVFVHGNEAVVIEPELEQVLVKRVNTPTFFSLLKNAQEITPNHFVTTYQKDRYHIYLKNGVIVKVTYTDRFGNRGIIEFLNPKQNKHLDLGVFSYHIDPKFDVIYE